MILLLVVCLSKTRVLYVLGGMGFRPALACYARFGDGSARAGVYGTQGEKG